MAVYATDDGTRWAAKFEKGATGHPVTAGNERWLEINKNFTTPVRVSYEWIHGLYEPAGINLDPPETGEDLHLQYTLNAGVTWITAQSQLGYQGIWQNATVDFNVACGVSDGSTIRFRWLQNDYDESGDNYALASVAVTEAT